jgi:hypothetical protein
VQKTFIIIIILLVASNLFSGLLNLLFPIVSGASADMAIVISSTTENAQVFAFELVGNIFSSGQIIKIGLSALIMSGMRMGSFLKWKEQEL